MKGDIKLNELDSNLLKFLLQLININEMKLVIIGAFILSLGLIFKPAIKDILTILVSKIKTRVKDTDKGEDL
ncbi:BlyA family holin [Borrelia turicatae]|uniref:BlyA family holin n=1 Tax=Borrelia turicatae TaxID=142 RepID=UPI000B599058|nr:holin, BlyA family [Borrelia turicatae]UPA15264.1 holin, BlyA family [Borrelia turicatae]UPA15309.1 holin, BlyA family [Borrelia turicatae]UPA15332.1 holin, BlyA family [Borrelia turicatae]UPA15374.1 holin, BlyA family [Borrelia turicatae]